MLIARIEAFLQSKADTSNRLQGAIALFPAIRLFYKGAIPIPKGVTTPQSLITMFTF
jgi:hypothetical protein